MIRWINNIMFVHTSKHQPVQRWTGWILWWWWWCYNRNHYVYVWWWLLIFHRFIHSGTIKCVYVWWINFRCFIHSGKINRMYDPLKNNIWFRFIQEKLTIYMHDRLLIDFYVWSIDQYIKRNIGIMYTLCLWLLCRKHQIIYNVFGPFRSDQIPNKIHYVGRSTIL